MCLHSFLSKQDRAHGVGQGTRSRGLGNQPRGWGGRGEQAAWPGPCRSPPSLTCLTQHTARGSRPHSHREGPAALPARRQLLKRTARLPPPPLPAGDCLPAHWPVPTLINPAAPGAGVASMPSIGSPRSAPPAPVDAPADPAWPRGALFRPVRCPCLSDAGRGGEPGRGATPSGQFEEIPGRPRPSRDSPLWVWAAWSNVQHTRTLCDQSRPFRAILAGPSPRPRPARGHGGRSLEAPHLPSAVTSPPAPSPTAFLPWAAGCCV